MQSNNEGNQICEIVVFNSDGNSDPSILNLKSSKSENDIIKILNRNEESSKIALRQLEKRNLKIEKSKSSILFDKDTIFLRWAAKTEIRCPIYKEK